MRGYYRVQCGIDDVVCNVLTGGVVLIICLAFIGLALEYYLTPIFDERRRKKDKQEADRLLTIEVRKALDRGMSKDRIRNLINRGYTSFEDFK